MRPEGEIKAAMEQFMKAAMKCTKGTAEWIQFVGSAGVLGWVLGEPKYTENTDEILRALRDLNKERVTR